MELLYEQFRPKDSKLVTDCVPLSELYPERGHPLQRVYVLKGKIVYSSLERDSNSKPEVRLKSEKGNAGELMAIFAVYVNVHTWGQLKKLINKHSSFQVG